MTDSKLSPESRVELRLGHLNMVQGIIGRLAGYSATVKNFTITIASAAVALTFAGDAVANSWAVLAIALLAVALLALLDTYYLALERAFRDLHEEIAKRPLLEAEDLSIKRGVLRPFRATGSFSVWSFYGPLLVVVGWLLWYN